MTRMKSPSFESFSAGLMINGNGSCRGSKIQDSNGKVAAANHEPCITVSSVVVAAITSLLAAA